MPELPEVEIVRRGLEQVFVPTLRVNQLELRRWDLRDPIPRVLPLRLKGAVIESVTRRAKYLLLNTSKGSLISHLGMTGSWRVVTVCELQTHDHAILHLSDGRFLIYRDPRRFGVLDWIEKGQLSPRLQHLGPEPLEPTCFHADYLCQILRKRQTPIKVAIMNQEVVVGVGNIYASEALFRAHIRPTRRAHRITRVESERLVESIRSVLTEAIGAGGSSIRDYVQANGESGAFQERFSVYDRCGLPCVHCQNPISQKVLGGRSTYWCTKCQR